MSESFSVGEIAIWVREGSPSYGAEVTVTSPLHITDAWQSDGTCKLDQLCYSISNPNWPPPPHHNSWCARPEWLRKRPASQDWKSLCNLTDVPRALETV